MDVLLSFQISLKFIKSFFPLFENIILKDFIYLFLERGEGREKDGEKNQCVVASRTPPSGDLVCSPGMCPDWESNWQPLDSQAHAQSTELYQPGL